MTQINKQTYAVFGLGRFGFTLAYELSQMGQDVIAVDKDMNLVEAADEFCTALSFDMTDIDAMEKAGIKDVDTAIVATRNRTIRKATAEHIINKVFLSLF